jgi:predicted nucleic acid-binding protein
VRRWFLDASYLIALEWKDDQWHSEAMAHWASLRLGPKSLVTTSFVIDEVVNFFVSRGHHQRAIKAGDLLLSSGGVDVVWAGEELVRADSSISADAVTSDTLSRTAFPSS